MTRGAIWRANELTTKTHVSLFGRHLSLPQYFVPALVLVFLLTMTVLALTLNQQADGQAKHFQSTVQTENQQELPADTAPPAASEQTANNETSHSTTITSNTSIVNGQPTTSITVNGEPVAVPQQGTTQQTIQSNGTETQLNVTVDNTQSSGSSSAQAFSSNNSWVSSSSNIVQFNSNGGR